MKRFTPEHALDIAQRFCDSEYAKMWSLFGSEIRAALLDAVIMDEMRIADSADSEIQFTATQVIELRGRVVDILASGCKPKHAHSIRMRCYKVNE